MMWVCGKLMNLIGLIVRADFLLADLLPICTALRKYISGEAIPSNFGQLQQGVDVLD